MIPFPPTPRAFCPGCGEFRMECVCGQYFFDFDDPKAAFELQLRDQWARNEAAQAGDWTREALCLAWVTKSDGRAWKDWWDQLPNYERHQLLNLYDAEQQLADARGKPMRPYRSIQADLDEAVKQHFAIAELWARDIKEAAVAGRPMPYRLHEDATPAEAMRFRSLLRLAMDMANVVIVEAPQPEPPKPRRRRKLT